jgi:phosphoglycolate phosphatase-like HAD superfamily hydrolase
VSGDSPRIAAARPAPRAPRSPRAVIFDMDGTLTEALLDFDAIRSEIGLAAGLPILEQLADGDAALRARGEEIMRRHEREAIARATLAEGCLELLARLRARGVPAAILTRNTREVVETFVGKFELGPSFARPPGGAAGGGAARGAIASYTREDGPPKPAPDGALHLCRLFGVAPAEALVVGDFELDILAGRRAGCRTALVTTEPIDDAAAWGSPDVIVRTLRELVPLWAD